MILKEMKGKKISMSELAKRMDVSRSYVSDALTQNKASLERLILIAENFYKVEIKLTKKSKVTGKGSVDV